MHDGGTSPRVETLHPCARYPMHPPHRLRIVGPMALFALFAIGCTDSTSTPAGPDQGRVAITAAGQADIGEFELCAVGPLSIFRDSIDHVAQTPRFKLGPDNCVVIATSAALGVGNHTVTVIEDILTGQGQVLDSIVSTSIFVQDLIPQRGAPLTGTNAVTQTFNGDRGWLVQFYNH
jgi:hypothetical protein